MKKIKSFVNKFYSQYGETAIMLILLLLAFYDLCMVDIAAFELHKQVFFYKGSSWLIILALYLRKADIYKNIPAIAVGIVYVGYFVNWLYDRRNDWGEDLQNYYLYKYIAFGLLILVLMDVIKNGIQVQVDKKNPFVWITFIAFAGAFILEPDFTIPIICPCLAIYLVPFTEKNWEKFETCTAIAVVCAFLRIMTKSLFEYKDNYSGERFYGLSGIAQNGALCGITFICLLFLIYKNIVKYHNIILYFILFATLVYNIFFIYKVASRSSILASFVTLLAFLALILIKNKKSLIITISSFIIAICGMLIGLNHICLALIEEGKPVPHFLVAFQYINQLSDSDYVFIPKGDIGAEHQLIQALDYAANGRLSIWFSVIKTSTLFGKNPTTVQFANGIFLEHSHCNFLDWILRYGWISGLILIVWFLYLLFKTTNRCIKEKKMELLYPAVIFFLIYTFFDIQYWNRLVAILVIILQCFQLVLPKQNTTTIPNDI